MWKNKDPQKRTSREVIPLDFTPIHLPYPSDWKNVFATKGLMLALHVPASFARYKNRLTRALYRVSKSGIVDVRNEWNFINELRQFGFNNIQQQQQQMTTIRTTTADKATYLKNSIDHDIEDKGIKNVYNNKEDPVKIIKRRLAKGEISKEEYEELRNALQLYPN